MELIEAVACLAAAVLAVPLFKRIGLGSVLGYLFAGLLVGPSVLHLVHDAEHLLHLAEFGVVLLLFIIGLELQPSRLWQMRRAVFGTGFAQVAITATALTLIGRAFGLPMGTAGAVGFALALSSTAFALQVLGEKNEMATPHGRAAFGILLFQDIAAIPALALIPLLGGAAEAEAGAPSPWVATALATGVIVAIVVIGRYVVPFIFKYVVSSKVHELSVAWALLLVVATALVMTKVGLSGALGAFLAGVLLADSDYRHELESNIEPFKGLLLGLFFMAVGMNADLNVALQKPLTVLGLTFGLVGVKAAILYFVGWKIGLGRRHAASLAVAISQGGEFAFVLFEVASGASLLPEELQSVLVLSVTLSMVVTPLLFMARDAIEKRLVQPGAEEVDAMNQQFDHSPVIIAGFGRYGQIVGRLLRAKHIPFTALDSNVEHIDFLKRFGNKVFYGDAARADLLRAAGAEHAHILVVAVDDVEGCLHVVQTAKEQFPHLKLFVRARNRQHAFLLLKEGVDHIMRETFHSSLETGAAVLSALGLASSQVAEATRRFVEFDEAAMVEQAKLQNDQASLIAYAKRVASDLENIFEDDAKAD